VASRLPRQEPGIATIFGTRHGSIIGRMTARVASRKATGIRVLSAVTLSGSGRRSRLNSPLPEMAGRRRLPASYPDLRRCFTWRAIHRPVSIRL